MARAFLPLALMLASSIALGGAAMASEREESGSKPEAPAASAVAVPGATADAPAMTRSPTVADVVTGSLQPPPSAEAPSALAGAIRARVAEAGSGARAAEERAALSAFYEAQAFAPQWVGPAGLTAKGDQIVKALSEAGDWGLTAGDLAVPEAKSLGSAGDQAAAEIALSRAALRYARQARGGRIDPLQLSNALDRKPPQMEPRAVLDGLAKSEAADTYLRGLHPQHVQFHMLREAWLAARGANNAALARKLMINMEQWRWMPDDLGSFHVISNVPEFMLRVVKDGKIVHAERMIAGLVDKQTPVFSAEMTAVTFHPQWGVPNSIKVKEILPGLLRGKSVMSRNNLKIAMNGREVDPSQVDWTKADIRAYHVYQPGGGQNVLGLVKFSFPNKHDVYMHDTPTKNLFNAASRTFSHGCVRVRDPLKFASVLLEQDKGWNMSRVAALAGPGGGQNNAVNLSRKIPVHVTYFTAVVDDAGKLHTYADPYGHEHRIQMGLDGKAHLIAKTKQDLGAARAEVIARLGEARVTREKPDWKQQAFGSN
jgi:murein L,D-transpeptidase YcbB/YkuD